MDRQQKRMDRLRQAIQNEFYLLFIKAYYWNDAGAQRPCQPNRAKQPPFEMACILAIVQESQQKDDTWTSGGCMPS